MNEERIIAALEEQVVAIELENKALEKALDVPKTKCKISKKRLVRDEPRM
jgi:hypothetical protein